MGAESYSHRSGKVMDFTGVPIREGTTLDYPTAWQIQREVGATLEHDPRCSSVAGWNRISGPHFLCDCGAVEREWEKRKEAAKAKLVRGNRRK